MSQKQYRTLVYSLILLLAGCTWMNIWLERVQAEQELQALVGSVYRVEPKAADLILQQAFSAPVSSENLDQGKQAAVSMGYTEDAFRILRRNAGLTPDRIVYLFLTGLLFIGLVLLQKHREHQIRQYRKRLSDRIRNAYTQGQELMPDKETAEWYSLECHIADILRYNKSLQSYMERREHQIQHFIENIAHQIKTPLAGILLNIENLKQHMVLETESGTARQGDVQLLSDSIRLGEQIQNHIVRLLNLARMEAGKIHFRKDAVELVDLLESLQERYGTEHIMLQMNETEEIYIIGDRDWLLEAMANIVENSLFHSGVQELVHVRIVSLKDAIKISVTDQGKGMTSEELQRLFDRYDTSGSSRSFATGIGMNLARCVIQAHYSDIHVESEPGSGTTVEFRLPKLCLKEKIMVM